MLHRQSKCLGFLNEQPSHTSQALQVPLKYLHSIYVHSIELMVAITSAATYLSNYYCFALSYHQLINSLFYVSMQCYKKQQADKFDVKVQKSSKTNLKWTSEKCWGFLAIPADKLGPVIPNLIIVIQSQI